MLTGGLEKRHTLPKKAVRLKMLELPALDSSKVPLRIGLLFHSLTSGNLGVGALTVANMAIARRVAIEEGFDPDFTCIGMRDGDAPDLSDGSIKSVTVSGSSLVSPRGLWKVFGDTDCVLDISGGDSFTDIYGKRRFFYIFYTKLMVLIRRKSLILSPMTIGPFQRKSSKLKAAFIMKRAWAVVSRDEQSLSVANQLAPTANNILATDVAFELPYDSRAKERGGDRPRVGLNVSGLLFSEAESGSNRFGLSVNYADYTRRLIEKFQEKAADIHLVTHAYSSTQSYDDDSRCADILKAEFPNVVRVSDFPDPQSAKSYISSLDFLIAGRMHACIGAYSSGTPVVAVAYSRKFSGLFGMLNYHAIIPVQGMNMEEAVKFTLESFEKREALSDNMRVGMATVGERLDRYREVLRELFKHIQSRRLISS